MTRRIEKHATRLSQQHQAALDQGFTANQRVMTIDGLPGRVLFVAGSFSPGITEYEVMLDNGMGQGVYTGSQLRALPADIRTRAPGSNLPAGVTAAFETEALDLHTAADDYPEMGSILHDRPDPGLKIEVIGSRRTAADSYGGAEDPRDEDYEGGANDVGVHWSAPAQQNWTHENEPPQEEAPPPEPVMAEEETSPVLARLAQIEEACQLVGARHSGSLAFGTAINGTEIDGHGDAPEHGTTPRASDPEGYDDQSTEGEEDPKWDEPLDPEDEKPEKSASSGMYPAGVSSDGGISVSAGRVPWTGQERGNLHNWDNGAAATWGDFVNSRDFTNRNPVTEQIEDPAPDVIEQELNREHRQVTAATEDESMAHLLTQHGYSLSDVARASGAGNRLGDLHDAIHDAGLADHVHPDPGEPRGGADYWPDLARARQAARAVPEQEHDAPALDEASDTDDPDSANEPGAPDDLNDPDTWPMTRAEVTSGGEAYTQGKDDGQRPWGGHKNRSSDALAPTVPKMMQQLDQATQKVQDQQVQLDKMNGPDDNGNGGSDNTSDDSDQHVAAFVRAASSDAFRFEFTAAWRDVLAKARRIRKAGKVRLTHIGAGMVIGEVAGDHDVYEAGIQRPPGKPQTIQHWACGCPWATFNQDATLGTRYAGRPCSHVMAVQLEAQSRSMFGQQAEPDPTLRELGQDPYPVVVRSVPPWTDNGWAQHWLAPAASLHLVGPDPEPGEEGYEEQSEEQAEQEQEHAPGCYYEHDGPCLTFGDMNRTAESIRHSRPRGYTSTIEPNADRDPDHYWAPMTATHVLKGHINGEHMGSLHFSVSDDGKAHQVRMLSSGKQGSGLGSAMMDDLYEHVKSKGEGAWLDHGVRTQPEGNNWWASYREPHPEISTHHAPAGEGWHKYFNPDEVAADAHANHANSGGRGAHTPLNYSPGNYQKPGDPNRDSEWTHDRGTGPAQQAVAALITAGEDPADVAELSALAMVVTADQANGPWGAENVSQHPPAKPYGATEKLDTSVDPGSYGFLSGPDPDNWGQIQENNLLAEPLSNSAALLPGGPYSADDPADPDGLGAEAELHDEPEPALPETTADEGEPDRQAAGIDGTMGDAQDVPHQFAASRLHPGCRVCGFGNQAPVHTASVMGDQSQAEGLTGQAQVPDLETVAPDDPSIQTIGGARTEDEIVAAFQRSAGARQFTEGGSGGGGNHSAGDIAAAAKEFLSKTADVLPDAEAAALISEGRGERARNLGLLRLEGTHYEDQDDNLAGRGLSLDDFDDDVLAV